MTLVAIGRIGMGCRVFQTKMVMRLMKKRMASGLSLENISRRVATPNPTESPA